MMTQQRTLNFPPPQQGPSQGQLPDFNKLAHVYRWMEWLTFGPYLHRARTAFLPELIHARHALILGDGDGRFTADLLNLNPTIQIDAVDLSPAMLQALTRRAGPNAGRVRTHIADARIFELDPAEPYDLVVTHFFLDCLATNEIQTLARSIRLNLAPGATWVLSDFAIPPSFYGRLIARPLVYFLYSAFNLLTGLRLRHLPDYSSAIRYSGFTLLARKTHLDGLLVSELWQKRQRESDANINKVLKSTD
jgi:SAM-dependent methyltransferase